MMKKAFILGLLLMSFSTIVFSQVDQYPDLRFREVEGNLWEITVDYPDPAPLLISLWDSTILEYTVRKGYRTNFRSGPQIVDIIAPQISTNNSINLAWLIHDIDYEGFLGDKKQGRKLADQLLYSMFLSAKLQRPRAIAVYWGVRVFGKNHYSEALNDRILFRRIRRDSLFAKNLGLPAHGMQVFALNRIGEAERQMVREEIRELFKTDADRVLAAFDSGGDADL